MKKEKRALDLLTRLTSGFMIKDRVYIRKKNIKDTNACCRSSPLATFSFILSITGSVVANSKHDVGSIADSLPLDIFLELEKLFSSITCGFGLLLIADPHRSVKEENVVLHLGVVCCKSLLFPWV